MQGLEGVLRRLLRPLLPGSARARTGEADKVSERVSDALTAFQTRAGAKGCPWGLPGRQTRLEMAAKPAGSHFRKALSIG